MNTQNKLLQLAHKLEDKELYKEANILIKLAIGDLSKRLEDAKKRKEGPQAPQETDTTKLNLEFRKLHNQAKNSVGPLQKATGMTFDEMRNNDTKQKALAKAFKEFTRDKAEALIAGRQEFKDNFEKMKKIIESLPQDAQPVFYKRYDEVLKEIFALLTIGMAAYKKNAFLQKKRQELLAKKESAKKALNYQIGHLAYELCKNNLHKEAELLENLWNICRPEPDPCKEIFN